MFSKVNLLSIVIPVGQLNQWEDNLTKDIYLEGINVLFFFGIPKMKFENGIGPGVLQINVE